MQAPKSPKGDFFAPMKKSSHFLPEAKNGMKKESYGENYICIPG